VIWNTMALSVFSAAYTKRNIANIWLSSSGSYDGRQKRN
jgi:hypothetical protein